MDDRCSSPEIDVVGIRDKCRRFSHRREMLSTYSGRNAWNIHRANQRGANLPAANTKAKGKSKVETVNLRVRNMGIIRVKKEPEEEEDCEVSYSLSSLLDECDFEQAPRRKARALKSPTSLALAQSKSVEPVRPNSVRPRQSLENVISSLKSARDTSVNKPRSSTNRAPSFQNPVVPISLPTHILSVAPAPHNSLSSGAQGASVPQIIDVRSLATSPHTVSTGTAAKTTLNLSTSKPVTPQSVQLSSRALSGAYHSQGAMVTRPFSAGSPAQSMRNVPLTKLLTQGVQVPSAKPATAASKPLNIRFVLPATAPFNTTEFQQILQAALAAVVSQSKGVDASLLQQAIQEALLTVAKSPQPFSVMELKGAIQDSLAKLVALSASPTRVSRQQVVAPKPPNTYTSTGSVKQLKTSSGTAMSGINPTYSPLTVTSKNVGPITQTGALTSGVDTSSSTSLNSARDALVKALQEKRILNSPQSLSSTTSKFTSDISPSVPEPVFIDEPCSESSPPSPEVPMLQEPTMVASSGPLNTTSKTKPVASTPASVPSPTISTTHTNPSPQDTISQAQVVTSTGNSPSTKKAPFTPSNSKNTTQPRKAVKGGCGGGCCQFCRTCLENDNTCGLPSCQKTFPSKQALRKHYYFNPNHALRIPIEKASVACENFLPLELNDLHRKARIRELFKRIDDDELKELLLPRLAKIVSLFQLLEQKSLRVSLGSISAFKMFTEFERFRKEVEASLLDLILQPQGKSCGRTGKQDSGLNIDKTAKRKTADTSFAQGSQTAASASGQDVSKDRSSSATSASLEFLADGNSGGVTSQTTKKTMDLEVESSAGKTTTEALKAASQPESPEFTCSLGNERDENKEEVHTAVTSGKKSADKMSSLPDVPEKKTADEAAKTSSLSEPVEVVSSGAEKTDLNTKEVLNSVASGTGAPEDKNTSSAENNTEHSGKDFGDVEKFSQPGMTTKQEDVIPSGEDGRKEDKPNSIPQSAVANQGLSDHQRPESLQPTQEDAGDNTEKSTLKNSTSSPMETDECLPQHVTGEGRISSEIESTDVLMADQEEANHATQDDATNSSKEEQKNKSQRDTVEKIDVARGEGGKAPVSSGGVSQNTEQSNNEQTERALGVMKGMDSDTFEAQVSNFTDNSCTQRDKVTSEHSDGAKETVPVNTEILGNTSKAQSTEEQIMIQNEDKTNGVTNENTPKPKTSQEETVKSGKDSVKPNVASEDVKLQQTVQYKAIESLDGDKEIVTPGSSKKTLHEGGNICNTVVDQVSEDGTTTSGKIPLEKKGDKQVVEVTSEKSADTKADASTEKESQETTSGDANAAEASPSEIEVGSDQKVVAIRKEKTLKETLEDLILEDLDELDEGNLMNFNLPLAVKWGRVIKKVKENETKKIARKENYSDQDMKHFIFHKPKEAANAVIIACCHAHPSFFRAYVMPALLDKHIDDFGVFGKKLLSRLYLSQQKYVQVLRNNIGPQLAKILGINIFPTYKRIQDTWAIVKRPAWTTNGPSARTVFTIGPEDEHEVPDDAEGIESRAKTLGSSVQELHGFVQSHANRVEESLKRASSANTTLLDGNKRQRLENSDAKTDAAQSEKGNKKPTLASSEMTVQKEARQLNEGMMTPVEKNSSKPVKQGGNMQKNKAKEKQKQALDNSAAPEYDIENAGSTSSSSALGKETSASQESEDNKKADTKGAEPMSVDQEQKQDDKSKDPQATGSSGAVEKLSSRFSAAQSTPTASNFTDQSAPSTTTSPSSLIPPKATIYTNPTGKKGEPSVPFPVTKGSPLFLVPIEKISPKLIEKFIQEANRGGVKTRSSDKKKGKQTKQTSKQKQQGSQVLVLVPSSIPNSSPTIQALTSSEQLESTGGKKPLLLLPADRVPKTIANQSQTVRRKMVITMVAQSSSAKSPSTSASTAASSTGDQSSFPTSAIRSVKGPIMSTQEGKSNTTSAASSDASKSVEDLTSVVNNTSALNSPAKERLFTSVSGSNESTSQAKLLCKSSSGRDAVRDSSAEKFRGNKKSAGNKDSSSQGAASAIPLTENDVDGNRRLACSTDFDPLGSSMLPSDTTLDDFLKDMNRDGTGSDANEMPSLDLSEIISSFGDMPAQSGGNTPVGASLGDTTTTSAVGRSADSQVPSFLQGKPHLQDDDLSYSTTRRQSPRRTTAPTKSASGSSSRDVSDTDGEGETSEGSSHDYSLRKTSLPFSSGASKDDSDADEGSPLRKRRRVPTRTNTRSSLQVTFVSDRGIPAKVSHTSPAKTKGKKH